LNQETSSDLRQKLKPFEILFRPVSLSLDDRFKSLDRERIPASVRSDGYPPSIWMAVALMRSGLTNKNESVAFESGDKLSGSQRPEAAIIHGHVL
jgi:hypothetical protein